MQFKSTSQMRAAFGGHLGPKMKKLALPIAEATKNRSELPTHVKGKRAIPDIRKLKSYAKASNAKG